MGSSFVSCKATVECIASYCFVFGNIIIIHADVVRRMSRSFSGPLCMYVSTLKQKPLDISSPNVVGGQYMTCQMSRSA